MVTSSIFSGPRWLSGGTAAGCASWPHDFRRLDGTDGSEDGASMSKNTTGETLSIETVCLGKVPLRLADASQQVNNSSPSKESIMNGGGYANSAPSPKEAAGAFPARLPYS